MDFGIGCQARWRPSWVWKHLLTENIWTPSQRFDPTKTRSIEFMSQGLSLPLFTTPVLWWQVQMEAEAFQKKSRLDGIFDGWCQWYAAHVIGKLHIYLFISCFWEVAPALGTLGQASDKWAVSKKKNKGWTMNALFFHAHPLTDSLWLLEISLNLPSIPLAQAQMARPINQVSGYFMFLNLSTFSRGWNTSFRWKSWEKEDDVKKLVKAIIPLLAPDS